MIRTACDECVDIPGSRIFFQVDGVYLTLTCSVCGKTEILKQDADHAEEEP